MLDIIKGLLALIMYLVVAPALGVWIKKSRARQRGVFALLVFATSWHINKITFMVHSIDWYRGATKGFEFSLLDVMSIALLVACRNPIGRWFAPGAGLYLLYVAASWVSIFAAPEPLYVCMAGVRFVKAVVVYLAAYHFLREEKDLELLLKAMAWTLIIQSLAVLKMKYVNHIYQVMGWFEHQNALAMWAYTCGLPLLAAGMSHTTPPKLARLYGFGYVATGIIVQSSLSRAALVFFAIGSAVIMLLSLCEKFTVRKITFISSLALVGFIGLAFTWNTISARFGEDRNKESSELRVLLIKASKLMLMDSSIGLGWNNYALVINKPWPYGDCIDEWTIDRGYTVDPDEAKPQPESHYWLILAENGYPGFLTYMLFLAVTSWWCLRSAIATWGTVWGTFLYSLFIALSIEYYHSTIERVLTQTKNLYMWLILLAFICRIEVWRKQARKDERTAAAGGEGFA